MHARSEIYQNKLSTNILQIHNLNKFIVMFLCYEEYNCVLLMLSKSLFFVIIAISCHSWALFFTFLMSPAQM